MPKGPFTVTARAVDSATGCINTAVSSATTPAGTQISLDSLNRTGQYEYIQSKRENGLGKPILSPFFTFESINTTYFDYARFTDLKIAVRVKTQNLPQEYRKTQFYVKCSGYKMGASQTSDAINLRLGFGEESLHGLSNDDQWFISNYFDWVSTHNLKNYVNYGLYAEIASAIAGDIDVTLYGARASIESRPYITWTWEDMRFDAPNTPTILAPANIMVPGNEDNVFTWNYYHSVTRYSPQAYIDLQYTANGGSTWINIFTQNPTPNQSIVIPANTLPAGNLQWRVRTYSVDPDGGINSSAWSAAKDIIVKAAPQRPQIAILISGPRPTFSWYVDQQEGVEIQVNKLNGDKKELVLQPRVVFGRDNQYRLPIFLPDGNYEIEIRSINSDSVWGEWGRYSFDVENIPGGAITLSTNNAPSHSIKLSWTTDDEYEEFYVLRNGIPIYKTNDKAYEDFYVNGFNSYVVRGIRGNYYTDSNTSSDTVKIQEAVISPIDSISWLKLEKKVGGKPTHNDTTEPDMEVVFFEGRTLPVAYTSERKSIKHDLSFTFHKREKAKFDKLREMIGKTVIYKDAMGANVVGVLGGFSASMVQNYDFNFSITETDFNEAITYD